ncbi:type VI secretion system-associated FHA domain protein [Rhizobium terrae]|uniref:type VI secretion system-associated FHA domain protein n=1 Tax=Rhizobium terrae TaxID=2171756 RepID=UPI0013C30FCB|nr:type VI secretion system-associated FHA domain protein [Rhizobium terrae]
MKIRLSLVGGAPSEHVFGPEGGTFGRSLKCQWVLSDDERILSAIHGRVAFENNKFILIDESTNGIFLDGRQQPLGRGNGIALVNGLRFRAAKHLIEAQILPAQDAAVWNGSPPPMPVMPQAYQPVWSNAATPSAEQALRERGDMGDVWAKNSQDPLVYLGSAPWPEIAASAPAAQAVLHADPLFSLSPRQSDPFAGLPINGYNQTALPTARSMPASLIPGPIPRDPLPGSDFPPQPPTLPPASPIHSAPSLQHPIAPSSPGITPTSVSASQPAPMPAEAPRKLIPDDFDPLSILAGPVRRSSEPRQDVWNGAPSPAPLPAASNQVLDPQSMAVLPPIQPVSNIPPVAQTPLPPVRESLSPSLMADMARLGEPAAFRPPAQDHALGDFDAIGAMRARREERKARLIEKAAGNNGNPLPAVTPPPAVPGVPLAPMPIPAAPLMPQPPLDTNAALSAGLGSVQSSLSAVQTSAAEDNAALIALFAGMGLPGADIASGRQVQVMREVGEMVRAFSEGLILLLSARRMVKSEFRMDETQVQPEENNPFKHFKMAELALDELFITRAGGFQAPGEAAASALEDLKQHVMLTMAAMQRAIKLLMERLNPENVARDNEAEGAHRLRGLGVRKGKWETYVEMHQRMSGNFDGMARQLIAEAFTQVQEEQARRVASQYWESKK